MANNILKYRAKNGLTQTELGEKLGISKAAVSLLEKNKLSAKNAVAVAEALNENPFRILGSDVLTLLPKTEEDKEILIETIRSL